MAKAYVPTPCRRCGGAKGDSYSNRYCSPCHDAVIHENRMKRSLCGACAENVWPSYCPKCRVIRHQRMCEAARNRKRSDHRYFKPFHADKFWQSRAHSLVKQAIEKQILPSLKDGNFACVDCGGRALEYDHRDYSRPFDVEPVCRSCNKQRGTAIWPKPDHFSFAQIGEPQTTQ